MKIQTIENAGTTRNISFSQPEHEVSRLGSICLNLMTTDKALSWTSPHVHQIMLMAFSEQRAALSEMPSSSSDQRLEALDVIQHRGFRPQGQDALYPCLTGAALGGMPRLPRKTPKKISLPTAVREQLNELEVQRNAIEARLTHEQESLRQASAAASHLGVQDQALAVQVHNFVVAQQAAVNQSQEVLDGLSRQINELKQRMMEPSSSRR